MDLSPEEWRAVIGYVGYYEVSSIGRIRRAQPGQGTRSHENRLLRPTTNKRGRMYVCLCRNGHRTKFFVHQLVASAFLVKTCPTHNVVRHKDDNPLNNCVANLVWGTQQDNVDDMVFKDRQAKGTDLPHTKLNAEKVREIRRLIAAGCSQRKAARLFGVNKIAIHRIVHGKTWKHVDQ